MRAVYDCLSLGLDRLGRGEALEAAVWFERALKLSPDCADGHVGLGIAYAVDSQIYPGLTTYRKRLSLSLAISTRTSSWANCISSSVSRRKATR